MPPEPSPDTPTNLSRRSFMKYMGAGVLLQTLVLPACRRTNQFLVPYNDAPEWNLPGVSTAYATCMPGIRGAVPMLAVCREGRPVKLEPQSWLTESPGLPVFAQASILGLYDPNRSKTKLFNGKPASEEEFKGAFSAWARKTTSGGRVAFLFGGNDSPLRNQMLEEIKRRNPQARFFAWEPLSRSHADQATEQALGKGVVQVAKLNQARRVLSFDCDFLGCDIQGYTSDYMKARLPEGATYQNPEGDYEHLGRLYMAEGRFSITGGMADERLPTTPGAMGRLIWECARRIGQLTGDTRLSRLAPLPLDEKSTRWLDDCVRDLCASKGQSIVLLGSQYPAAWHSLVLAVNTALNANGITLHFLQTSPFPFEPLSNLPRAVAQEGIDTLFLMCPANPLVDAPASWKLGDMLKTPSLTSIRLGLYHDETSAACTWHLPAAHYLETWGIERDMIGRYCYTQPVITPLYGGIAEAEILNGLLHSRGVLATAATDGDRPSAIYQRARRCFDLMADSGNREDAWNNALKSGVSMGASFPRVAKAPAFPSQETIDQCLVMTTQRQNSEDAVEIQFVPDYSLYDGRYSHNAWLRECPDPITGLCWDTPAQLSPGTAGALTGRADSVTGSLLDIRSEQGSSSFVACEIPGMADGLIVLPLSYGNKTFLPLENHLPSNTYLLRKNPTVMAERFDKTDLAFRPKGKHPVAMMPPTIDEEPPIPAHDAGHVPPASPGKPAGQDHDPAADPAADPVHQWAMNIDLTLCTGCNACLIACQAENNIPVVGPEQIAAGRIMHWIRIDRYLTARDAGNEPPRFMAHPVACQQCGKAPCESVCPVNATTHTSEGLNAMVYPRCWGTRYCAANCPYKARRFNFFDYADESDRATRMQRNPHVTVRNKGVMEKCTYCVQRIEDAKAQHQAGATLRHGHRALTIDDLRLPPDVVKTACQQACPASAITFGNLLQKDTVADARRSPRNHSLLSHLGTMPRTTYLSKIRNPLPNDGRETGPARQ